MIVTIILATALIIGSFMFHYRLLLWLAVYMPYPNFPAHTRVFFIVMSLFAAHIIEIGIYVGATLICC